MVTMGADLACLTQRMVPPDHSLTWCVLFLVMALSRQACLQSPHTLYICGPHVADASETYRQMPQGTTHGKHVGCPRSEPPCRDLSINLRCSAIMHILDCLLTKKKLSSCSTSLAATNDKGLGWSRQTRFAFACGNFPTFLLLT